MKPDFLIKILYIVLIPATAWGLLRDITNTANGGSIDLRNRVTGARIAAADLDPYSYKWMAGEPETFCDIYNEPGGLLSKTTVTPWVLAAHSPFNKLNYRTTQWLWFFTQYGCLALALLLWLRFHNGTTANLGIVIALMFCATPAWRHHVDHGQIYVVYALMLIVLYWLSQQKLTKPLSILEGVLGAFTLGSRPVFVGQFAESVKNRRWWSLGGAGVGLLIVFVGPMLLFGSRIWRDYRLAMEAHSELYLLQFKPTRVPNFRYPGAIEGIPIDTISGFSRFIPFADTSIFKTLSFHLPPRTLLVLWGLLMGGALFYLIWKKASHSLLWWSVSAWIIVGDFLLPAYRHTYNDILALPMILFGITALTNRREQSYWIYASGLVLLLMIASWQIHGWFLPIPSLALWCLAIVTTAWTLLLAKEAAP